MRSETTNGGKSRRETAQRRAFLQVKVQVKWAANVEGKTKAETPSPKLQDGKPVRPTAPNHETKSLVSVEQHLAQYGTRLSHCAICKQLTKGTTL